MAGGLGEYPPHKIHLGRILQEFQKTLNGKICILDDDPQCAAGNFRMIGNCQRAPDRMPEMNVTSFLVIDCVAEFSEGFHNIFTGKDGKFVRHMSTATKVSFVPGR